MRRKPSPARLMAIFPTLVCACLEALLVCETYADSQASDCSRLLRKALDSADEAGHMRSHPVPERIAALTPLLVYPCHRALGFLEGCGDDKRAARCRGKLRYALELADDAGAYWSEFERLDKQSTE